MILSRDARRVGWGAAVVAVLVVYPAACAGRHDGALRMQKASGPAIETATRLVPPAADRWLPAPAFAYAKDDRTGESIADVVARAAPSVVNIASSRTTKVRGLAPFFFDDPFFRRFFGSGMPGVESRAEQQHGLGSGVVVSGDGLVLTNDHVVEGADVLRVSTSDKREFDVQVLGTDAQSDLALLRLKGDTKGLTPIQFGDSSRLRPGDIVLAIGNPFALGRTVTMGIVSATGRANMGIADYEDFIQTDAAINPGNSGGALVDTEGKLVGINTAILSRSGGSMGIGFAIPSNMAEPISKALLDKGKVSRGHLGVGIQDVDAELQKAMKLPTANAVLVSEVKPGSPAAKAGLASGDVVLRVNGREVATSGELRNAVGAAGPGAVVTLDILRDGKPKSLKATLGELPQKASREARSESPSRGGKLGGLSLAPLDPSLREKLEIPPDVRGGLVVVGIDPDGAAANSPLRQGDVILEVNRTPVLDLESLRRAYDAAPGRVLVRVLRDDAALFLVLPKD